MADWKLTGVALPVSMIPTSLPPLVVPISMTYDVTIPVAALHDIRTDPDDMPELDQPRNPGGPGGKVHDGANAADSVNVSGVIPRML
ncbi:MAG: hypothetical protein ABI024_15725 [Vicinamibacterales bacterium]